MNGHGDDAAGTERRAAGGTAAAPAGGALSRTVPRPGVRLRLADHTELALGVVRRRLSGAPAADR